MKFTKTFVTSKKGSGRIQPFFHKRGYRLAREMDSRYTFKRGSSLAFLYAHEIKRYPTTVDVALTVEKNTIQAIINYRVNTTGAIALKNDKDTIMAEMNELEDYMKLN